MARMKILLLIFALNMAKASREEEKISVPVGFKRIGLFATGIHYGHLHLKLDLNKVDSYVKSVKERSSDTMKVIMDHVTANHRDYPESKYLKRNLQEVTEGLTASYTLYENIIRDPGQTKLVPTMTKNIADIARVGKKQKRIKRESRVAYDIPSLKGFDVIGEMEEEFHRAKRQILEMFSGLGSIVSMGLSLYTLSEVHSLANVVEHEQEDIQVLKHSVEEVALVTNRLSTEVDAMNGTLFKMQKALGSYAFETYRIEQYLRIEHMVGTAKGEVDQMRFALTDLYQGKLNPYLLNWPAIENSFLQLSQKAGRKNLNPLFSEWGWILNSPFSFYLNTTDGKKELNILVHVPFYSDNLLEFYKHMNIPLVPKDFKEGAPSFVLSDRHEFLAVDIKSKMGKQLTRAEYDDCQRFQLKTESVFICEEADLLVSDVGDTCLGALYYGIFDFEHLEKFCDMGLAYPKSVFHALTREKILAYTPRKEKVRWQCNDPKNDKVEEIIGVRMFNVPFGCKLVSAAYVFVAGSEVKTSVKVDLWQFTPRDIAMTTEFDWGSISSITSSLVGMKGAGKVTLKELREHRFTETLDWSFRGATALAVVVALICATV